MDVTISAFGETIRQLELMWYSHSSVRVELNFSLHRWLCQLVCRKQHSPHQNLCSDRKKLLNFCQFDFELLRELFFIGKLKIFYYQSNLSHSYVTSQTFAKISIGSFLCLKRLDFTKLLKDIEQSSKML